MNAVLAPQALPTTHAPIHDALLLPVSSLKPNPWNRQISAASVADLAHTVKAHGVLEPIVVRPLADAKPGADEPQYEIVFGERRWRAAGWAGLPTIPALVRQYNDLQVQQIMLVENLQREGLHELDEAEGYARLLRKAAGPGALRGFANEDELAESIGRSRSYVVQRLRLLKLIADGKTAFRAGRLNFSLALRIARLASEKDQAAALKTILQRSDGEPMSARAADDLIHRQFMLELGKALFKITDATLVPAAGSCRECPKRTGGAPDLFNDVKAGDTCTDGACFEAKTVAHQARVKAQAEERGLEVLEGKEAKKVLPHATSYSDGQAKGYLPMDEVNYRLDGSKTLRKLLGKADIKPVLVEQPVTKALIEMVPEKQALAALKAAGAVPRASMPGTSAGDRERADKAKRETAWRTAVATAIGDAARGAAGEEPHFRAGLVQRVAYKLWQEMTSDTQRSLVKLLGWPPLKSRWDSGPGVTAEQQIAGLVGGELCRYLTLATIVSDTHIATYQTITKPEALLATAQLLGVDVQACKDSVREVKKVTPPKVAAKRAVKRAAELKGGTAIAGVLKGAQAKAPAAKYRCPATGSTWSGRGLQPAWLTAAIAGGATLASFQVPALAGAKPAAKAVLSAAGASTGLPMGGAQ